MRILVLGTGDHAIILAHAIAARGWSVAGWVGRTANRADPERHHSGDCGSGAAVAEAAARFGATHAVLGFGDNGMRAEAAAAAREAGLGLATVVHPAAFVDPSAELGAGCFVGPGAVVNLLARLGEGVLVNAGAIVEHDCRLGDHGGVFTGAALGGTVTLGRLAMVGLGARVVQGRSIGDNAVVGAGAVVVEDVPAHAVVAGVPARLIRSRAPGEAFL